MAVSVTLLGESARTANTTVVITTGADAPAGQPIVVIGASNNANVTTPTDQVGNTYTNGTQGGSGIGGDVRAAYVLNPTHLPSGDTITVNLDASQNVGGVALTIQGALTGAIDNQGAGNATSGTLPSMTEGVVSHNNRVVIGFVQVNSTGDTFNEAAGFTTIGNVTSGGTVSLHVAYAIVNTPVQQTYAPTLGTSRSYAVNTLSLSLPGNRFLGLMGVGV